MAEDKEKLERIFQKNKIAYSKDKYYEFIIEKSSLNKFIEEVIREGVGIKDLIKKEFSLEDLYLDTIKSK